MNAEVLTQLEIDIIGYALRAYDDSDLITVDSIIARVEGMSARIAELEAFKASVPWKAFTDVVDHYRAGLDSSYVGGRLSDVERWLTLNTPDGYSSPLIMPPEKLGDPTAEGMAALAAISRQALARLISEQLRNTVLGQENYDLRAFRASVPWRAIYNTLTCALLGLDKIGNNLAIALDVGEVDDWRLKHATEEGRGHPENPQQEVING